MAQGSRQVQTQAQQQIQTLSPQQILVVKLLELPAVELEDRVRAELLENPALEEGKEDTPGDEYPDTPDTETGTEDGGDTSYDSLSDYLNEDDIPDYKLQENNRSKGEQAEEIPFSDATSFYETLRQQLGEQDLTPHQRELAEYLIGSLDDDGLLRKSLDSISDELAIYAGIDASPEELEEVLKIIQDFDPAGLGARDTLRMEASLPLYGHEMGTAPDGSEIPIFAVPLAKFAVSFSAQKGDYIGRTALEKQQRYFKKYMDRDFADMSGLPRKIAPIALVDRGVMRADMEIYQGDKLVGWVTSGTMVPYFKTEGEGLSTVILEASGKRAIGLCYIDSNILTDDPVEVDVRGKRLKAVIPARHMSVGAPPFARPLLYGVEEKAHNVGSGDRTPKALELVKKALENHQWRQEQCVNLIPSENTPSRAVRLLSGSDPACRYAEHKRVLAFYEREVFYYQGTKFIDEVERLLVEEMRAYFGCTEVETRTLSGQMSNMAVFSALMDWKNRFDRKSEAKRLGYVMNNHIIKGGHLSAQPMGALHDYIAIDPVTEKPAVVNFPVCADNPYKMDVEEAKKLLDRYRPELIVFGKSMVLHKEPVAEIRKFVDEQNIHTTIMYDMAHVLGLIGDHFQNPFAEGAELVTGSTHKTFFGPQRGIIGVNYQEDDLKYGLWKTIQSRTFPGSVSNHHLGTQLGMLMAAYEMNQFRDTYQRAVIDNAKSFARSLKAHGLDVAGDPAIDYTETHQVIVSVGYGEGPEIAERLERNNIVVNYQATPNEEGFTASGALRMGVSEMTRFGFEAKDFDKLAGLMADCILRGTDVKEEVQKLRGEHLEMRYCFDDAEIDQVLEELAAKLV